MPIFFLKSASIEKKVITYIECMGYWITNDIASQGYWFCVDIYISEISGTFIVSNAYEFASKPIFIQILFFK